MAKQEKDGGSTATLDNAAAQAQEGGTPPTLPALTLSIDTVAGKPTAIAVLDQDGDILHTEDFLEGSASPATLCAIGAALIRAALVKGRACNVQPALSSEDRQTLNDLAQNSTLQGTEPKPFRAKG